MLTKVQFKRDHRVYKKDEELTFRPGINLLVGDQGCGKSTLLELMRKDGHDGANVRVAFMFAPAGTVTRFLDFEKGGVRSQDFNSLDAKGIPIQASIAHTMSSHGESVRAILKSLPIEKNITLMDEPDMALSMRSIKMLYDLMIEHVEKYDQQIIASCHNPYLMELVGEVYSLEHRAWMTYPEFRASQEIPIVK